jgi:hypothetical protein
MAVAVQELAEMALAFLAVDSVLFLVLARELIVRTGDHAQPVTGQPAPAFPHAAAQLLPLAFEAVPVHASLPRLVEHMAGRVVPGGGNRAVEIGKIGASQARRSGNTAIVAIMMAPWHPPLCTLSHIRGAAFPVTIGSGMYYIRKASWAPSPARGAANADAAFPMHRAHRPY